ncbi:MAG: AlbA family DNA-binding domain-containing protein [Thermodesulfovibrionales bacterium]
MIGKELTKIEEKDLQDLIDNVVLEGKTIEYKAVLPGNSDGDKKEFLADVSSFANAGGGDIIFGMTEDPQTKEPKSLDGLDLATTVDQEKTRLDNIIREGVEPRMPAVHIHTLSLATGKTAIVIRVGKSWVSPHRVIFKGHDKFYSRNSSGKYPLDVGELRTAFTMSETITERIRRFREERIASLYANETPVPMNEGTMTVLHILPVSSFASGQKLDVDKMIALPSRPQPMRHYGYNWRYTLEGHLTYSSGGYEDEGEKERKSHSYVHLYRSGIMEFVEMSMLRRQEKFGLKIPSVSFEKEVIEAVTTASVTLKSMEVPTPLIVFLTLVKAKGYSMGVGNIYNLDGGGHPIDRDVLVLPELVIENYDDDAGKVLKPVFDAIWNACGHSGSRNYNDKGEWTEGKR